MALEFQNTSIQSTGISSNTVLSGVTTVTTLNATNVVIGSNANISGILTASGGVVANLTGNTTGTHIGNVTEIGRAHV